MCHRLYHYNTVQEVDYSPLDHDEKERRQEMAFPLTPDNDVVLSKLLNTEMLTGEKSNTVQISKWPESGVLKESQPLTKSRDSVCSREK